ncbi:MAG: hypothetical protein IPO21_07135 [Bacteroidales bacterium]|nr:hypothetical protein [Bacteroidales bacterium]
MNIKKLLCFLLTVATVTIILSSCSKNNADLAIQFVKLNKSIDVEDFLFLDSLNGFLCGGVVLEEGCIYKTSDGGETWDLQFECTDKLRKLYMDDSSNIYAVGDSLCIIKSTDFGNTWQHSFTAAAQSFWFWDRSNLRGLCKAPWGELIAVGRKQSSFGLIYHDGKENDYLTPLQVGFSMNDIIVHNNEVVVAGYGALFTVDSLFEFDYLPINDDNFVDLFAIDNSIYACGYNGGIYKIEDGDYLSQKKVNKIVSFSREHFLSICFADTMNGICCGERGVVYATSDGGNAWKSIELADKQSLRSVVSANSYFLIGSENGIIYRYPVKNVSLLLE